MSITSIQNNIPSALQPTYQLVQNSIAGKKLSPEEKHSTADALYQWPKALRKPLVNLPLASLGLLLAAEFGPSLVQIGQEFAVQFLPRVLLNGGIRQSGKVILDEAAVEIPEYGAIYLLPPLLGLGLAFASHKFAKKQIPHFELLGKRIIDLEKEIGNKIKLGTVQQSQEIPITQELVNQVAFHKAFNNIAATIAIIAAEVAAVSSRTLTSNQLLQTNNFYDVSGFKINDDEKNDGSAAVHQAKLNIKYSLLAIPTVLLGLFAAKAGLSRTRFAHHKFFTGFSKAFDMGSNFGLSRLPLMAIMGAPLFAYTTTGRNLAESLENWYRIALFSIPTIIFYKQGLGTFLTWAVSKYYGINDVLKRDGKGKFAQWEEDVIGKNAGARDPLDISFGDISKDQYTGKFTGGIPNNPDALKLKAKNPEKYKRAMRNIHWAKEKAPLWLFAFPLGIAISWINYQRTKKLHEHNQNNEDNSQLPIIDRVIDKLAHASINFQQRNYQNYLAANNNNTGLTSIS